MSENTSGDVVGHDEFLRLARARERAVLERQEQEQEQEQRGSRIRLVSVAESVEQIRELRANPPISTGFPRLDLSLGGGIRPGQLYALASGTGIGKTSLACQIAMHHARGGGAVLYATYEMSPGVLSARMAAQATERSWLDYLSGVAPLETIPPNVPNTIRYYTQPVAYLSEAVGALSNGNGKAPLVVVDYLQKAAALEEADRRIAIIRVSDDLRALAASQVAPVLAISSANRLGAQRIRDGKSSPSSLVDVAKESGEIEYDSAAVLVLSTDDEPGPDGWRDATLAVAKNRFGLTTSIPMAFRGEWGRFREIDEDDERIREIDDLILVAVADGATSQRQVEHRVPKRATDVRKRVNVMLREGRLAMTNGRLGVGSGR